MASPETRSRVRVARPLMVAGVIAAVAGLGWYSVRESGREAVPAAVRAGQADLPAVPFAAAVAPVAVAPAPVVPAAVAPVAPAMVAPSFDVVRVGPQGSAVIAGRAAPGAEVVVRDGATEVARGTADRQGAFVAVPTAPLAEGGRELSLVAKAPGQEEVRGDGVVVLTVPPAAAPVAAASVPVGPVVALLVPSAAPPRVIDGKAGDGKAGDGKAGGGALTLDTVDYDDAGAIRFTGQAGGQGGGSATVRVYVDNALSGDAQADGRGRWTLMPGSGVAPGVHTLRVDRVGGSGKVVARVELPFERAAVAAVVPGVVAGGLPGKGQSARVVVQPGQNLWRMARYAYGRGVEYRVIYLANREQIRDPRLIYPGQAFAIPER